MCTKPRADEVHHFCDHQRGYDEWTRMGTKQVNRFDVVAVTRVNICVERTSINDDSYRSTSPASICSIRSEISS